MKYKNGSSGGTAVAAVATVAAVSGVIGVALSQNNQEPVTVEPTLTSIQKPVEEPKNCLIKGNINNKGEKIYHMPGQKYYSQTVIEPEKGERWFCTEQEATSAGWRKSKV